MKSKLKGPVDRADATVVEEHLYLTPQFCEFGVHCGASANFKAERSGGWCIGVEKGHFNMAEFDQFFNYPDWRRANVRRFRNFWPPAVRGSSTSAMS